MHHSDKPKLEWVGRILGMDLYVDTQGEHWPEKKRELAERMLMHAFEMNSKVVDKHNEPMVDSKE